MLGIRGYNKKKGKGVPTGSEHIIYMYPLDFEEFLWAKGISDNVITYLKECFINKKRISNAIHTSMLRYFKEYICVDVLPEAVNIFLNTGDMNQVYEQQNDILEEYKDDFGKHLDINENVDQCLLARILEVFNSIPFQLAKENKKFQFSKINSNAKFRNYYDCITWLSDAGVMNICYQLNSLELPLSGNCDTNKFKLYFSDTGLLVSLLDDKAQEDLRANKNLGIYKGGLYENIVSEALIKSGYKLYYYKKANSTLEEDFFIRFKEYLIPIEVKSKSGHSKSLSTLILSDKYKEIKFGFKLSINNIGNSNNIYTFPYFCTFIIKRMMKTFKLSI